MATGKRTYKRHKPLIQKAISPHSIEIPSDTAAGVHYAPGNPIVVAAGRRPALLLGRALLEQHLHSSPGVTIAAIELKDVSAPDRLSLRRLDVQPAPLPSEVMHAVMAARRSQMPLAQVAELLPGVKTASDVSVYASLSESPPYVLEMLDRGKLTLAHVRRFIALPSPLQRTWAERVVAGGLTVAGLVNAMSSRDGGAASSADFVEQERILGDALGSRIHIEWNGRSKKGTLVIPWYDVESLQGIMELIGSAPPAGAQAPLPQRLRKLGIEFDGIDEFDALVGHLLSSSER